jgi:hypothetical protein
LAIIWEEDEPSPENIAAPRAAREFFGADEAGDEVLFRLSPDRFKNRGV